MQKNKLKKRDKTTNRLSHEEVKDTPLPLGVNSLLRVFANEEKAVSTRAHKLNFTPEVANMNNWVGEA